MTDPEVAQLLVVPVPSGLWTALFTAGAYAMAAGCLYRGIKEGARVRWTSAVAQVAIFAFFTVSFWFIESWAHYRAPFYLYSAEFVDLVSRLHVEDWVGPSKAEASKCARHVLGYIDDMGDIGAGSIPLSVPLTAASLTYSVMWTARYLRTSWFVQPFVAGLIFVIIDLLLDPVAATTHDCDGVMIERSGIGLGLWRWYLDPKYSDDIFHVPIFNYAAWFTAPVILISLVNLGTWFRRFFKCLDQSKTDPTKQATGREALKIMAFIAVAGAAITLIVMVGVTPGRWSVSLQLPALGLLVAAALVLVFWRVSHWKSHEVVDPALIRPVAIVLLIPASALLWEGFFLDVPMLIPVGILSLGAGMLFIFLPYRSVLEEFCGKLGWLDHFVRFHYFGLTAMLVLLGAATVGSNPGGGLIGLLLVVGVCFHIYTYMSRAAIERWRAHRGCPHVPPVADEFETESLIAGALVAVFAAGLAAFILDSRIGAWSVWAPLTLVAGFALVTAYNLWGGVGRYRRMLDLPHGIGWGSLAVYGALAANPALALAEFWQRPGPLFVYGTLCIFLSHGVHGKLGDDGWDEQGHAKRIALAYTIHTAMFAAIFYFLYAPPSPVASGPTSMEQAFDSPLYVAGVEIVIFLASSVLLWLVLGRGTRRGDWTLDCSLLLLLLPPFVLYALSPVPDEIYKVIVACCIFVPLALRQDVLRWILEKLLFRGNPQARCAGPPRFDD